MYTQDEKYDNDTMPLSLLSHGQDGRDRTDMDMMLEGRCGYPCILMEGTDCVTSIDSVSDFFPEFMRPQIATWDLKVK